MAPDIDFGHYLDLKYQNQGMQARAAQTEANARASFANAQTGQVAANDAASRAQQYATARNYDSESAGRKALLPNLIRQGGSTADIGAAEATGAQRHLLPRTAGDIFGLARSLFPFHAPTSEEVANDPVHGASFNSTPAAGGDNLFTSLGRRFGLLPAANTVATDTTPTLSSVVPKGTVSKFDGSGNFISSTKVQEDTGFKKGIARVPGKGNGMKDTVKAKLAPGEAVLNKAAADHMGRGLIGALNKAGAQRMGMT